MDREARVCGLSGLLISVALCVTSLNPGSALALSHELTPARIVNVSDGDTVIALDKRNQQIKVRLAHIDAPETGHGRCRPGQPFSDRSKQKLAQLVKGREVGLLCTERDRYGRSICDIHFDGTTASRELARAGMAWANRARPEFLKDASVASLEAQAVKAKVGLWSDSRAVSPWVWRKESWGSAPGCAK